LLFEIIDHGSAKKNDETVSFSVEKVWQSYKKKGDCFKFDDDNEWKEGIQQYYDGSITATKNFCGPSYDQADTVVKAFKIYVTKLIYFTNSNSTVLASISHAILKSISQGRKLGISALVIIKQFDRIVLGLVEQFNDIVTKLSDIIGKLADSFNDDLNELGCAFSNFMKKFIKNGLTGYRHKVEYEPVLKRFQKLVNTVALFAETLVNHCELATSEVNEAVTILTLIVEYFAISVHGVNTCYQSLLHERKYILPQKILSSSVALDYVLHAITRAVDSVVFPFAETITALLTQIVNITMFLNTTLKDVLGIFEGVTITVGEITQNLSKSVKTSVTGVTMGLTNILKGIVPK